MDYSKIVAGRRRNWDALKDPEQRRREQEEERERQREEAEKAGKPVGFYTARERRKEAEAAADLEKFQTAKRQAFLMLGGLVAVFLLTMILQAIWTSYRERVQRERLAQASESLEKGGVFTNLSDPISAYAAWRSAWMERDVPRILATFSKKYMAKVVGDKTGKEVEGQYRRMLERGGLDSSIELATNFFDPEPVHVPSAPWQDEELAIFRSQLLVQAGVGGEGTRYLLFLSYNAATKQWRFADARDAQFGSVKWRYEGQIRGMVAGPRAVRYDEDGNQIEE